MALRAGGLWPRDEDVGHDTVIGQTYYVSRTYLTMGIVREQRVLHRPLIAILPDYPFFLGAAALLPSLSSGERVTVSNPIISEGCLNASRYDHHPVHR